ncbi:protein C11orf74 homolog [Pecten maximus]|uniref:protein C11orf74 homolog n=1 Tax=Pecten maximus TaxID=6579 RepID=UPI001458F91D|nr:protein C11orf74 homolog [Pecten maximus]XP_033751803.1 protein C11orf74 homolog [Pecten maximus]
MSDISLSPTPSQENLANVMDASMYNAIDTFMAREEQSYDNFMKQFTHLTHDDIKAKMLSRRTAMLQNLKASDPKSETEGSKQSSVITDNTNPGVVTREEEGLEEEVLDIGTTSSIMSSGMDNRPTKSAVQFDNFVELDEDDDEDILEGSEYIASFSGQNPSVKLEEPCQSHNQDLDFTKETDSQRELTPVSITTKDPGDGESSADCGGLINPGEVEVLPSVKPITQNDQTLDFSAKEGTPITFDHQECTDEVEPFTLDKDFDYDNVILTPKYSEEDVQLMKDLREQNQTEKSVSQENGT